MITLSKENLPEGLIELLEDAGVEVPQPGEYFEFELRDEDIPERIENSNLISIQSGVSRIEQIRSILTFPSYFTIIVWQESDLNKLHKMIFLLIFLPTVPFITASMYIELSEKSGKWLSKEEFHQKFKEEVFYSDSEYQMGLREHLAVGFLLSLSLFIYLSSFRLVKKVVI